MFQINLHNHCAFILRFDIMAFVKVLLVFASLAMISLCQAIASQRVKYNGDQHYHRQQILPYENRRSGSSVQDPKVNPRFPVDKILKAAGEFPKISTYYKYLATLSNKIEHQQDFEYGQFVRIVYGVTFDSHTTTPEHAPTRTEIHNAFEGSFAASMGNYTLSTQEKLHSVKESLDSLNYKLCQVATKLSKLKDKPADEQMDSIAQYIESEEYGAQEVNALLKYGNVINKIKEIKFDNLSKEVGKNGGAFVLVHRPEVEDLAFVLDKLWHSVAMVRPGLYGFKCPYEIHTLTD